jgi:hypothetical protein
MWGLIFNWHLEALAWLHYFTKRGFRSWAVMFLWDFATFYDFLFDFGIVLTVWYFFHCWIIVEIEAKSIFQHITCTHVKHSHDHISSLRGDVWAHISHLTLPLFIDRSMPSQEREWSCTCLLVVLILLPLSTILLLDCGTGCSEIEVQNCKRNETISLMKTRLVNYPL